MRQSFGAPGFESSLTVVRRSRLWMAGSKTDLPDPCGFVLMDMSRWFLLGRCDVRVAVIGRNDNGHGTFCVEPSRGTGQGARDVPSEPGRACAAPVSGIHGRDATR